MTMDKEKALSEGKATGRAVLVRKPGGPEALEMVDDYSVCMPEKGEVLVKMVSTGVNNVDCIMRTGGVPLVFCPAEFPCVLGGDGAGIVFVAPEGSKFKEGDKIMFNTDGAAPKKGSYSATYAEFCLMKEDWAAAVPDVLPLVDAGGVSLAGLSALQTLDKIPETKGERLLVLGASGGVGQFALQFAKARGAYVVGVCSAKNFDQVRSIGADEVFDYAEGHEALKAKYGAEDKMFDGVIDLVGGALASYAVGAVLRRSGTVASLMTLKTSFLKVGWWSLLNVVRLGPRPFVTNVVRDGKGLERISAMIADGKVKMPKVERMPVSEVQKAHEIVGGHHAGGKIVLTW